MIILTFYRDWHLHSFITSCHKNSHIVASIKLLTFSWGYIEMHFPDSKILYFNSNFTMSVPKDPTVWKSFCIEMTWCCQATSHYLTQCSDVSFFHIHWDGTGSWNPSVWKIKTCLYYIVNNLVADVLAMQGARASAAMISIKFSWNIPASVLEELISITLFTLHTPQWKKVSNSEPNSTDYGLVTPCGNTSGSTLAQAIMACCLMAPEPMLTYQSKVLSCIYLRAISKEMLMNLICNMGLQIALLE